MCEKCNENRTANFTSNYPSYKCQCGVIVELSHNHAYDDHMKQCWYHNPTNTNPNTFTNIKNNVHISHGLNDNDYNDYIRLVCYDNVKECGLVDGVANVLMFGAKKYAPNSWKTHKKDFLAACYRHLAEIRTLQNPDKLDSLDKESGLLHLDHAICNLMFLRHKVMQQYFIEAGKGLI